MDHEGMHAMLGYITKNLHAVKQVAWHAYATSLLGKANLASSRERF